MSTPFVSSEALRLLDIVQALVEWQSNLAYLKDPPPGYLLSGTDIMAQLDSIRHEVENGAFTSEYVFQQNLMNIFYSAHDGHLYMALETTRVFTFVRPYDDIVSISLDDHSQPELYVYGKLIHTSSIAR